MKTILFVRTRFPAIFVGISLLMGCQKPATSAQAADTSNPATTRDLKEYLIPPADTDPGITTHLDDHFASVTEGSSKTNVLFVFLPGSYRNPTVCRAITRKAATMGHHAIGLMYANTKTVNPLCSGTNDVSCHRRARLEIVDGIDRHPEVSVNPSNSVINRLQKLLEHLDKTHPRQGWGQYLINGKPNWARIIIGGHSQGAACAGVIGKYYPVKRVVMLSMIDFMTNGKIPDWLLLPLNKDRYYFLTNVKDELVPFTRQKSTWQRIGTVEYGEPVNLEEAQPPFYGSRILLSHAEPEVPSTYVDKYHNSTAVDLYIPKDTSGKYIYDDAWEYLLSK